MVPDVRLELLCATVAADISGLENETKRVKGIDFKFERSSDK